MKKAIASITVLAALLVGCSSGDEEGADTASTTAERSGVTTDPEAAPDEPEEGEEENSCHEAARLAAEGSDFDTSACSPLTSFKGAYRIVTGDRIARADLIELLQGPCEGSSAALCQDLDDLLNPPTTTTTTTTAPPTTEPTIPAPVVHSGQGDNVVEITAPDASGVMLIYARHTGSSNFVVRSGALLVNTIGGYEGVTLLGASTGDFLEITADGDWVIEIRSALSARRFDSSIEGAGDDVLYYSGDTGPMAWTHGGESNFVVRATGGGGLQINEIGPYQGTVLIGGDSIIEVTADGPWSASAAP